MLIDSRAKSFNNYNYPSLCFPIQFRQNRTKRNSRHKLITFIIPIIFADKLKSDEGNVEFSSSYNPSAHFIACLFVHFFLHTLQFLFCCFLLSALHIIMIVYIFVCDVCKYFLKKFEIIHELLCCLLQFISNL